MGGKVLVSTQEHIDRLVAGRLAADVLGVELIIVARTDAEAATLLDSNVDGRDHPFILGATTPGTIPLNEAMGAAAGAGGNAANVEKEWSAKARVMTFGEAVLDKIASLPVPQGKKQQMIQMWQSSNPNTLSNAAARRLADNILGKKDSINFDWDACRVREGYYRIKPGIEYCIQRGIAYAPFADLIWMETAKPGIPEARTFSEGVKKVYPNQVSIKVMLLYLYEHLGLIPLLYAYSRCLRII